MRQDSEFISERKNEQSTDHIDSYFYTVFGILKRLFRFGKQKSGYCLENKSAF